ncbi:MAG: phage holin family protein [Chlorobiaceae bacterium]|nr:phage holin family protein [Chlorobiaceae bacterium]
MINRPEEKASGQAHEKRKHTGIHKILDESITSTYEDVIKIVEAKIELVKIELTEKISVVSAMVILGVILIIGIAYLITTFALLTGELLGHPFLGYLLVSLIFISCFVFFTKFKPSLLKNLLQNFFLSVNDYKK